MLAAGCHAQTCLSVLSHTREGTLKLRLGVAPKAEAWVSFGHQPRRGPATRNDMVTFILLWAIEP